MAAELTIHSIYRLTGESRYFLLRTERPEFSNASQEQEDITVAAEQDVRNRMLHRISEFFGHGGLEFIGELQNYPVGDALYSAVGKTALEIYYIRTQFGHPWIILGDAASEEAFLSEIEADEDLVRLMPTGHPIKIKVTLYAESDLL